MRRLKVYFDRVLVYDVDGDCFTDMRDLRRLGWLRDAALNVLVPLYYCDVLQRLLYLVGGNWVGLKYLMRRSLQCPLCRWGVPTPWWRFCLRYECPPARSLREIVGSTVKRLESWRR